MSHRRRKSSGIKYGPGIAVATAAGVMAYGGAKLYEAGDRRKGVAKLASKVVGGGAYLYGFYYAASIGTILLLSMIAPPEEVRR